MMAKYHLHHHRFCSTTSHKNVDCVSIGGDPDNEAVCVYTANGHDPSEFTATVTGKNPNLATFTGYFKNTSDFRTRYMHTISETLSPQLENLGIPLVISDTL